MIDKPFILRYAASLSLLDLIVYALDTIHGLKIKKRAELSAYILNAQLSLTIITRTGFEPVPPR